MRALLMNSQRNPNKNKFKRSDKRLLFMNKMLICSEKSVNGNICVQEKFIVGGVQVCSRQFE